MGYYLRNNTEHAIFATRGKPTVPEHAWPASLIRASRTRHSEKPPEFFEVVEQISPTAAIGDVRSDGARGLGCVGQ